MFGRPTRSYAHVEHDADGMSSVAAAPYSLRKEGTFKTYRARVYCTLLDFHSPLLFILMQQR